jgi:bifunctional UDP-N-acetylglucosamine pyrophosphorylase/glucosamine-1-phosphate N-acetyltransferase
MLRIANKPLVEHLVITSKAAGIGDFIFIVGYRDDQVREYFQNGEKWGVRIQYRLQREPRGTADALGKVRDLITAPFLVMNGDVLTSEDDLTRLAGGTGMAMAGKECEDVEGLGVIEVRNGNVVRIHEKSKSPPTHLVNAGFYRFTPAVFEAISSTPLSVRGEYELTDSLQLMIDRGEKISCPKLDSWLSLTYPWDLLDANKLYVPAVSSNAGIIEKNVSIEGPCTIGRGTRIRSGSYIEGPVIIGEGCDIGPNCFIRPVTAIEDGCHIGSAVEIKNSIIMKGTKVPHQNYVGDSIMGENCNLGAGTKIANLRLDKKDAIDGCRRKLGAIFGDNVSTGINSCINVGTHIGDNSIVGPGAVASGDIGPNSRIF